MRRRAEIRIASSLAAEPAAVATWALSAEGINGELGPWFRMTVPRGLDGLDLQALEPGPVGRSWLLLFGLVPIVTLLGSFSSFPDFSTDPDVVDLAESLQDGVVFSVVDSVTKVAAAIVFIMIVRQLTARHRQLSGEV